MDFQSYNFDPVPDDELICSICRCVFSDPVEGSCQHVFCRHCITQWLSSHRTCPTCRKRLIPSKLHSVVPIIKNMIMKLTVRCQNSGNGCTEKPTTELYASHIRKCAFEVVKCANVGCHKEILREDLKKHESLECAFRQCKCSHCELLVLHSALRSHNCIDELRRILKEKEDQIDAMLKEKNSLLEELNKLKSEAKTEVDSSTDDTSYLGSEYGARFSSDSYSSSGSSMFEESDDNAEWSAVVTESHDTSSFQIIDSFTENSLAHSTMEDTLESKSPSIMIIDSTQHSISPGTSSQRDQDSGSDDFVGTRLLISAEEDNSPEPETRRPSRLKRRRYSPSNEVNQDVLQMPGADSTAAVRFGNKRHQFRRDEHEGAQNLVNSPNFYTNTRRRTAESRSHTNVSDIPSLNCSSSSSIASTSREAAAQVTSTLPKTSKATGGRRKAKATKSRRNNNNNAAMSSSSVAPNSTDEAMSAIEQCNRTINTTTEYVTFLGSTLESSDPDWEPGSHFSDSDSEPYEELPRLAGDSPRYGNVDCDTFGLEQEEWWNPEIDTSHVPLDFSSDSSYEVRVPPTVNDLLNRILFLD